METIKRYTQAEFDGFEVVNGYKICPMGDYSEIKDFGDGCKFDAWCYFGEGCSFGERCIFGEGCSFEDKRNRLMIIINEAYDNVSGLFYYACSREWELELMKTPLQIVNRTYNVGDMTDVEEFFDTPLEYVGKDRLNQAVFRLGNDADLFEQVEYYEPLLFVTPTRFFKLYKPGSGRDYNYIKGTWK